MSTQAKLTKRQYLTLGSLLFGMFFGALNFQVKCNDDNEFLIVV
ncbi:hypothetical protein [Lacticaseibacillus rhamnosus]|nr:hypothetical protein [Lacticaseibacillus rhamnosus]MCZ2733967.1 hypothetical protein [Lacticaseibacillus rhamnosus]MCZ2736676.1 hypothetical protein [Lacticaseibacillus rhamnosus]MCZ2743013.1 hypothetical protein [Lacticaseibacillus rhamnosus]MCZ2745757.1 hypothetical protein [Lacticaseibacillus rhamnosus]MCZ2748427.1 hypothetical protein [Lacticaseibacillus rhamnosus]